MTTRKINRNDPCPCGSGKKYKHCCMHQDRQRRRVQAAPPVLQQDQEYATRLDRIRSMATQLMPHVPPDQAQELRGVLDKTDEIAACRAMQGEIDAAARALEPHRSEFMALIEDGSAAMDQAHRLFSEERFTPWRYTAADVHRAFEAVGYPQRFWNGLAEEDMDVIVAAVLYLADDEDYRFHLARQLLMMLPEYVSAGRYLDAWLIQYTAYRMAEALDESNPFLVEMFNHGFEAWVSQLDSQQEAMLRELGLERSTIDDMSLAEVEAWLDAQMADPAKKAQVETFYAAHPMVKDQVEAEMVELERGTWSLLQRDDADPLYLSQEELEPWLPVAIERSEPIRAQAQRAAERGEGEDSETLQALVESLVEVAREMVPLVFTPGRLDQLRADLKGYRHKLLEEGEKEAAMHAHAALAMAEREGPIAENPLLVAICFASLRLLLITLSEEAGAWAEGETEAQEVEG
jgi:hypothetical protein